MQKDTESSFQTSNKDSSKNNFLYEPRMPGNKKACFLSRSSLYFISFGENGNFSEFLLIFLSYLIKTGKMNHKISCMPFLHERNEQKPHVALSRGAHYCGSLGDCLHFSNWTWSGERVWKLERNTNSRRSWGRGEESVSLAEKLVKNIFLVSLLGV